jgi:AcrR family transcriptional regulator
MSTTARRQKYKAELRGEILSAAREIFVRGGYEGFTIRKLTKRIGYSPGNIYLYFEDKNEIFDRLFLVGYRLNQLAQDSPRLEADVGR